MTEDRSDRSLGRRIWKTPYYIHGLGVAVAGMLVAAIGSALDLDGRLAVLLYAILVATAIVISTILYSPAGGGQKSVTSPPTSADADTRPDSRRSVAIYGGVVVSVVLVLVILQIISSV